MTPRFVLCCLFAVGFACGEVLADPVNTRPVSPGGLTDLQAVFDSIYVSGPGVDANNDQINNALFTNSAAGGAVATFVIELSTTAGSNAFGIYSSDDPTNKAEIFGGAGTSGDQAIISFFADGRIAVNFSVVATNFSENWGFYMDVPDNTQSPAGGGSATHTVYSEDSLNPGGAAQALIYQGDDKTVLELPGFSPGPFNSTGVIVAFEGGLNGTGGSDGLFTDLVVLVEAVTPVFATAVPAPGAAMLAMVGMGLVGWTKRRKNR